MTENPRDLWKFGLREMGITAELLTRYANGHKPWASDQDELSDGVAVGGETVDHDSDLDAYCGSCDKLLPWPTYVIRCLDGLTLREATTKAAELVQSGEISGGNA